MDTVIVDVVHRCAAVIAEGALKGYRFDGAVRRAERRAESIDGGVDAGGDRCRRGDGGIEVGVVENVILLGDAILALRLEDVAGGEPIVEEASAKAKDVDRGLLIGAAEGPGEAETRRGVGVVRNGGLTFEAEADVERDVLRDLPLVVNVSAEIIDEDGGGGPAGDEHELSGAPADRTDCGGRETVAETLLRDAVAGDVGEDELAVVARSGDVAIAQHAVAEAGAEKVLAVLEREVVLELVRVLVVAQDLGAIAAAVEGALHDDRGRVRVG